MSENLTGQVIKSYELREMIGEGGFGAVYSAYQKFIGREVAIKIILPQHANRPDFIRRFETEAQLVARLEHPHIVPLYDYWREPSGAYLVMRLLRGGSIYQHIQKSGAWDPLAVSQVLTQIGEALAVAHRQGVIHRDIKPENIILDDNNNAYLSDFGIAKHVGGDVNITQNNAIVGSPAYLSPEQIKGEEVTPQSDIYSLGIVLFEMLSGQRPFQDTVPATLMYKHLSEPIPDIMAFNPDLPPAVNDVLQRATAKDPEVRHVDTIALMKEFRRAIKSLTPLIDTEEASRTAFVTSTGQIILPEPENPYKGLRAFQQADSADFFGREKLVENILDRLREDKANASFLAVVGPSGSGKSSVVKAGILPAIRNGSLPGSEAWFIVEMVPGLDPLEELEAALLRIAVNPPESLLSQLKEDERGLLRAVKRVLPEDETELVLFIDQFEEVFTLVEDEEQRLHLLNSLVVASIEPRSRIRIIITLRADFYDRPLAYNGFGNLMRERTEIVLPMDAKELERAIVGPTFRVGMHLENGLAEAMIADVIDQPGALPLLQYALTELYERRTENVLTKKAYEEIGGTMGALAQRADELYDGLDEEGEEAARQLFLRLVTLGEGTEDTRRRAMLSNLLSIGDEEDKESIEIVIDAFGRYRLLTFDHDTETRSATVEVAHEALIRQWRRLRDWLDESREDLRMQRRLFLASEEWLNARQDPSFLARGARLGQFEEWYKNTNLSLTDQEENYLKASIATREEMLAEEKARQQREEALERRSQNRLRALVFVMTIAALIGFVLAIIAFTQTQAAEEARTEAEDNAEIAQANADEARGLALAANARNALNEDDSTLALLLALEADRAFQPSPIEVKRTLATTAYGPGVRYRFTGHDQGISDVDFSSDGRWGSSASSDGTARIWDAETGENVLTIALPGLVITSVAFNPDASNIVLGTNDNTIYLYDTDTGAARRRFIGHKDVITDVQFTPDGLRIVSSSFDTTIRIWDAITGREIRTIDGHTGTVLALDISPDGQQIASSSGDTTIGDTADDLEDRTIRIWNLNTGEEIRRMTPPTGFQRTVAFSPDGRNVATAAWNSVDSGVITVWRIASAREIQRFYGHTAVIPDITFTPNGQQIISSSWDQTVRIWDIATGIEAQRFEIFGDRVLDTDISHDGQFLIVGTGNVGDAAFVSDPTLSEEPSVWIIDLVDRSTVREFDGHGDWVWSTDISPDGNQIISGTGALRPPSLEDTVRIWDARTGEELFTMEAHTGTVEGIAFSPDGTTALSSGWDGQIFLWDATSGEQIRRFGEGEQSYPGSIPGIEFHPEGTLAAAGTGDGTLLLWDVDTGQEIWRVKAHDNSIPGVEFSPDGAQILTGSWDTTAKLWSTETGELIQTFEGHRDWVNDVAYSATGEMVASSSWDNTIRLWNAETGELIREFIGHNGPVQSVDISADGTLLLSGSGDTTMRLWDIATGQELFRYTGHEDWVSEVHFTPDGFALSSAQDQTLRLWQVPVDSQAIADWAGQNRYIRDFTCTEREVYRVEPLCDDTSTP